MKKLKLILKRILIVYVVFFIAVSSMSSSFGRMYDAECGEFLADETRKFITQTLRGVHTSYENHGYHPNDATFWSGGSFGRGTFRCDCSSGVYYMYYKFLGVDISGEHGCSWTGTMQAIANGSSSHAGDWEVHSISEAKPGDIVFRHDGSLQHAELYLGNGQNANFGASGGKKEIGSGPNPSWSSFTYALRPKFDVNPTGAVASASSEPEEEKLSIYDSNGFIYSGVAQITGYKSGAPFGKWIFKMISQIFTYLLGIMELIFRVVIVGWAAIIERVFIDGIVNAITGVTNKRSDDWKKEEEEKDEIDLEIEKEEEKEAENVIQPQATGDENKPSEYISAGMHEIANTGASSVQLKTSSEANVTIENIVYNKIPILDVNFFNFESAGGAVVDEDGIIYVLKENIAMWYYIFRIIAIIIMLMVLIYLGIKMAISTVAEKKAVYKEMLISWILGFVLLFTVHYMMYGIIYLNEVFISWIIPISENGQEISLYETVRSMAYEPKSRTGMAGAIFYIVLIYYCLRFLLVYFKRYLTLAILALISPFVAVMYAISKINKKGKGGEVLGNWLRDFMYTTWLQSIHALIYTLFIQIVLDLTEISLTGMFIAFIFMHYMIKVDSVMRQIFGFSRGKSAGKLTTDPIMSQLATAKQFRNEMKKPAAIVGGMYNKAVLNPLGTAVGTVAGKATQVANTATQTLSKAGGAIGILGGNGTTLSSEEEAEIKEKARKRKIARNQLLNEAKRGAKIAGEITVATAKAALVVPMLIAEPGFGVKVFESTLSSAERIKGLIKNATKNNKKVRPKKTSSSSKFKLKGVRPKNANSAQRLKNRFDLLEVPYSVDETGGMRPTTVDIPNVVNVDGRERRNGGKSPIFGQDTSGSNIKVEKVSGNFRITLKDRIFETLDNFLDSDEKLTIRESAELFKNIDKGTIDSLSKQQKVKLMEKIGIDELELADEEQVDELMENVSDSLNSGDIDSAKAVVELLAKAKKEEEELGRMYDEMVQRIDEEVSKIEETNPGFAKSLRSAKTKEMSRIAYVMSNPLSEKDIYRAMQNYQSKVPQFDAKQTEISQRDIEGITRELNTILARKGTDMQMSDEFMKKVSKELQEQVKKQEENRQRDEKIKEAHAGVGTDVSIKAQQKSLKERVKEQTAPDRFNPNAESNSNSPKQNSVKSGSAIESGSSVERLVKGIKNASKGSSSKRMPTGNPRNLQLTRKIEDLLRINEEAREVTGSELYTLDEVMRRLERI